MTTWCSVIGWPGIEERACPPRTHPGSSGFRTLREGTRFGALSTQRLLPFFWCFFDQLLAPSLLFHLISEKGCPSEIHWKMGPPSASAVTNKVKQKYTNTWQLNGKLRQSVSGNTRALTRLSAALSPKAGLLMLSNSVLHSGNQLEKDKCSGER